MPQKALVIGSGFAGLSAAAHLAKSGAAVTLLEQHNQVGGRARSFESDGFTFDMGPSWYWMPEVFERFYNQFGHTASDFYDLKRLDPSYRIWYGPSDKLDMPASMTEMESLFESIETGSALKLRRFLAEAKYKYDVGMGDFVHKPSLSLMEFADLRVVKSLFKLQLFGSVSKQVRGLFKDTRLVQMLEFPSLFLGATPQNTPALYTLMNYADLSLGTWYPMGGMHGIAEAMYQIAVEQGVQFELGQKVSRIIAEGRQVHQVMTKQGHIFETDIVVAAADYNHIEQQVLDPKSRQYDATYWDKRTMAPSSLLFYIGVSKKLKNLLHHNLFFDADFGQHAKDIYESPNWPEKPLFYVCAPSVTDPSVAPEGSENLFILIPLAPGLKDSEAERERFYNLVMERLENLTGQTIRDAVVYKRGYAMQDFVKDYNAFKGNAYGLANTLWQTAFLKPRMKSTKLGNLYYAGQLTTPGPGMPPSIISGEVAASLIKKEWLTA
jgi:phytoene desaturase